MVQILIVFFLIPCLIFQTPLGMSDKQQNSGLNQQSQLIFFTITQTESWSVVSFLTGMVVAMFTAALQCCRMDSSLAGASICASTLAGCCCGTKGKSSSWEFKGPDSWCYKKTTSVFFYCSCAPLKNDDWCAGFSHPGHLNKLLHDMLHLPWTLYLWSMAP